MLPSYNFICLPLDTRNPESADRIVSIKIITELQFPMGFPHDPTTIRNALNQHPLLVGASNQPISALVWSYRQWTANGRAMDPRVATKVDVRFSDARPPAEMLQNLLNYLGAATKTVTPSRLRHDSSYENLDSEHFVHVTKTADDLRYVTHSLKISALRSLIAATRTRPKSSTKDRQPMFSGDDIAQVTNLHTVSFALAKWVDGAMHSSLLGILTEKDENKREQLFSEFGSHAPKIRDIREAIDKINKRITKDNQKSCPSPSTSQLKGLVSPGESPVIDLADPNIAIHSAIKNSLIASACGFVTTWSVESPVAIYGDQDYVIQLDVSSFRYDNTMVEVQSSLPTAFRRAGHTHPVSYGDIGSMETHNCALACLNDASGQARYRATSVNAETGVVKEVILQSKNSLSEPSANTESNFGRFNDPLDLRVAQLLPNDRFGTPEPETSGVVFSAPSEDLMVPKSLQFSTPEERRAAMPCLFLEDLWIGYRLDLKEAGKKTFTTIHAQEQQITFTQSAQDVSGLVEDYIEREQRDDPSLGHSSTDLTTYNGLSSGQTRDYLILLGVSRPPEPSQGQPFTVRNKGYGKGERLTFGRTYDYRMRNVFIGAVSCDSTDLKLDGNSFSKKYRQQFPFFRARAFRPGEVLIVGQQDHSNEVNGKTIYLTAEQPNAVIALVPSPIDIDTSRFHGLLLANKDEVNSQRKHITDLGKFFKEVPPSDLNYFYDPDVYGVIIRAKMVNGNEEGEAEALTYVDGTYCKVVKHVILEPISETYGPENNWQQFKPIVISFHASQRPMAQMRKRGLWGQCRHIEIGVPPAAELHLSLVPLFNPNLFSKTSSYIASSAELQEVGMNVLEASSLPIPAVAEQIIEVIHAVKEPRKVPLLVCDRPRRDGTATTEQEVCIADRKLDNEFGNFYGRIELDSASTKEVRLEAAWADVNDDPSQERYVLEPGKAVGTPRSVVFREFEPEYPSAANFRKFFLSGTPEQPSKPLMDFKVGASNFDFADQFVLQCVEDKVFLGQPSEAQEARVAKADTRLNFKDLRRKLAKVEAVAVSRFAQRFKSGSGLSERHSNLLTVDVPSTIKMMAPRVSHVVPLRRDFVTGDNDSGTRVATFGIRIYLRKEWFESGVGERLAIGCVTGGEALSTDGADILKYVTQWGEDPIERAALQSTMRMPRASDFVAPEGDIDNATVDEELYPASVIGGRTPVIYRDNVRLSPSAPGGEQRWVSVASFAVRYDNVQRLWYADVQIAGDFFGRCGMALYRHQPHALPSRELSEASAWVYAAVLYGEPVAWVEKQGNVHVTIGPVYDANVSFDLDSLKYRDGISDNLSEPDRILHPLKGYRVGKALYFEAVVPEKHFNWGLFKKRFGYSVASTRLNH